MQEEQHTGKGPSILKKIGNKNPFEVPEGYFDTLADAILDQVDKEKDALPAEGEIRRLNRPWRKPLSYAAAIALTLIVTFFLLQDRQLPEPPNTDWVSEVSLDEIESYVLENLYEFEEGDFLNEDLDLETDLLEGSFEEGELESLMPEILDDIDMETIENML